MKRLFFLLTLLCSLTPLRATEGDAADFRLMSFNIERGDLGVKKGRGWDNRKDGCLAMLALRKPDLLGLQECSSIQRDDILGTLEGYRFIGVAVSGAADHYPTTSGNQIIYNPGVVDLLADGSFWYAFDADKPGTFTWMAQKPRNATWGRFRHKASGREFIYVNNHLQNGVDAVINRSMSLQLLLRRIRQINPDGLPLIYSGDLNSLGIEDYYGPLNEEMHEAARSCPETDLRATHGGYKSKGGTKRIDHIYYKGAVEGLRYAVDQDAYAGIEHISDHFPIYVDFRFLPADPDQGKRLWFDLTPAEDDVCFTAGSWNLWHSEERGNAPATSWKKCRAGVASAIVSLGADLLGVQELSQTMCSDLPKLIRKAGGVKYKVWTAVSNPEAELSKIEAIGLIYNTERFSISKQKVSWIRGGETDSPAQCWDSGPHALLSAVCTDKISGRKFFVMTAKIASGKKA